MRQRGPWVALLPLAVGAFLLPVHALGQAVPVKATGQSELVAAVKAKDGPGVSKLLRAGINPDCRDADGRTPLHIASSEGDLTVATLLLAAGADVNAKDAAGLTPLHKAAAAGSRQVANVLLASGANGGAVSSAGLTPAGEASRNHHQDLADFLGTQQASPRPPKVPGQARTYTNDDLGAVRRDNRLANEGQIAQAQSSGFAPVTLATSSSSASPTTSGPERSALAKETRVKLQRAYDRGDWTEDIEAAQQFSRETRHPILALFTGSDWCHFCKLLEASVLSTTTFRERVKGKYILLYVDFPRRTDVPKEVMGQRTRLSAKYGVMGFPTLVALANGDHVLDKIFGFKQGTTAEEYVSRIEAIAH